MKAETGEGAQKEEEKEEEGQRMGASKSGSRGEVEEWTIKSQQQQLHRSSRV